MTVEQRLKEKRQQILIVAAKHGASNIRVFGSVARGQAGPTSDLDLLVDMRADHSLLDRVSLILDLEEVLGQKVDVATERVLRPELRARVLREAVPL